VPLYYEEQLVFVLVAMAEAVFSNYRAIMDEWRENLPLGSPDHNSVRGEAVGLHVNCFIFTIKGYTRFSKRQTLPFPVGLLGQMVSEPHWWAEIRASGPY